LFIKMRQASMFRLNGVQEVRRSNPLGSTILSLQPNHAKMVPSEAERLTALIENPGSGLTVRGAGRSWPDG
jgi:hypothetical protein